ncbi:MAG: hypothetical protein KF718_09705 [Polyangiaceae bacterium]|nr:hypothetical protein [Polyangiaceae bacterium]
MSRLSPSSLGRTLGLGALPLALACSADLEHYTTDAESGTTHALVTVDRSILMDGSERAGALASFVQLPAEADARAVLDNVGLRLALPPVGQCRTDAGERPRYRGRVELVEAGAVSLLVGNTLTELAPHAFPTVTDVVSGVVYATRDVSAEPLPADADYTLRVDGSLGYFSVSRAAPEHLTAVTIGGVPLADVTELSVAEPMDLTWGVRGDGSVASDVVWVELANKNGTSTVCTFRDELGAATIPAGSLPGTGPTRLSLHRLRIAEFVAPAITLGELRFDFELQSSVSFVP